MTPLDPSAAGTPAPIDYAAIKARRQATWANGDFAVVGTTLQIVGESLASARAAPWLWGSEAQLKELFGRRAAKIDVTREHFNFRYRSAAHFIQIFRDFYGPTHKAFAALDEAGKRKLDADLTAVLEHANTRPGSLVIPAEYLEVVVTVA